MNTLHLSYNDPLFSLILLMAIIFMLALFNYWWLRYRKNQESSSIEHFFSHFQKEQLHTHDDEDLSNVPATILQQLAHAHFKEAAYQESIEIYVNLLARNLPIEQKRSIMNHLGYTYFKAGFLERSQTIFLQIIKQFPRDIRALQTLQLVYESKKEFERARDVTDSLTILDQPMQHDQDYIALLQMRQNFSVDTSVLTTCYERTAALVHPIFMLLFEHDANLAWQTLKPQHYLNVLDILWYLDADKLNLDMIATEPLLRQIYSARGDISSATRSEHFELDLLIALRQSSSDISVTMSFEYICTHCKRSAVFAFGRCIHCHHVSLMHIQPKLIKESLEIGNAFL